MHKSFNAKGLQQVCVHYKSLEDIATTENLRSLAWGCVSLKTWNGISFFFRQKMTRIRDHDVSESLGIYNPFRLFCVQIL